MKKLLGMMLLHIFLAQFLVQGCSYHAAITPLDPPARRERADVQFKSVFDGARAGEQVASIGDELFVIRRFKIGEKEEIKAAPLRDQLQSFPINAVWTGTHLYHDKLGSQFTVYTSPSFYNGQIGAILDKDGNLATSHPLIQVMGVKKGRRWRVIGNGKFIQSSVESLEAWGLRYSGKRGTAYVFEIVDKRNANVSEIIQSIHVSEADFLKGFTIRGVFVQGFSTDRHGVIKYSLKDSRTSP